MTTSTIPDLESERVSDSARVPKSEVMQRWEYRYGKRAVDIVGSAFGLVCFSPIFLLVGLLIKTTSPGPVFYPWHVVGLCGRNFKGHKFRSMVRDADQLKHQLIPLNEMKGPVFKMKDDPRITPIGRVLRKYSIDELPQLWSVLKGDMSLVGPHPAGRDEWVEYQPWQRNKLSVIPGMTCLWQVEGRNQISDFAEWARMDLRYIESWSLWLDCKILAKTLLVVIKGTGQ